jgi:hypothetical protein
VRHLFIQAFTVVRDALVVESECLLANTIEPQTITVAAAQKTVSGCGYDKTYRLRRKVKVTSAKGPVQIRGMLFHATVRQPLTKL